MPRAPDAGSGNRRRASTAPTTPTGTLTRKMARHPSPATSALTSSPPSTWPPMPPRPDATAYHAIARGRARGGTVAVISPRTCGSIAAAVRPCSSRNAISCPGVEASPHSSDAAVKDDIPMTYMRRWPNMSPRRPPVINPAA